MQVDRNGAPYFRFVTCLCEQNLVNICSFLAVLDTFSADLWNLFSWKLHMLCHNLIVVAVVAATYFDQIVWNE